MSVVGRCSGKPMNVVAAGPSLPRPDILTSAAGQHDDSWNCCLVAVRRRLPANRNVAFSRLLQGGFPSFPFVEEVTTTAATAT